METALSGAGWDATGSQSVQARQLIDSRFDGLGSYALAVVVHSSDKTVSDPGFRAVIARVERTLRADDAVATVVPPRPGIDLPRRAHGGGASRSRP